jgi:hypothetical protein
MDETCPVSTGGGGDLDTVVERAHLGGRGGAALHRGVEELGLEEGEIGVHRELSAAAVLVGREEAVERHRAILLLLLVDVCDDGARAREELLEGEPVLLASLLVLRRDVFARLGKLLSAPVRVIMCLVQCVFKFVGLLGDIGCALVREMPAVLTRDVLQEEVMVRPGV